MNSKKILTFILAVAITTASKAQKKHELGATMNAEMGFYMGVFYNTNWTYKVGTDRGAFRMRLNKTQAGWQQYQGNSYLYLNSGLFLGYEFRKTLKTNEKIAFIHGPEVGSAFNYSTNYGNYNPAIRYFFGMRYQWLPNLNVSVELPSSISSNFYRSEGIWQDNRIINAGLLNESSLISVVYCW